MELADRLLHARLKAGLDLYLVADHLGVRYTLIRAWENGGGVPDMKQGARLATLYGVDDISWWLRGDESGDGYEESQAPVTPLKSQIRLTATQQLYLSALYRQLKPNDYYIPMADYMEMVSMGFIKDEAITLQGKRYADANLEIDS